MRANTGPWRLRDGNRTWLVLAGATRACALVLAALLAVGCDRAEPQLPASSRVASESLTLAITPYAGTALIYVALAKGYFESEGLKVTVQTHSSGKVALDATLAGNADVATVAELPVTLAVLKGHPVTVLTTLSTQTDYGIVGRTDKGISTPLALKGKRIAVTLGTSADFFLDALLVRQRLSRADVQVIDRKPNEMADVLEKGGADAVSTWEPHVSTARERLGADATVLFSSEGIYESTFNLAATREFASTRGETVKKLLRALVRAEQFFANDAAGGEKIVAESLKRSPEETRQLLSKHHVALALDQNLLVLMEDESRWAIRNKVAEASGTPNFLNALYIDGLAAVKPRSVTVIH